MPSATPPVSSMSGPSARARMQGAARPVGGDLHVEDAHREGDDVGPAHDGSRLADHAGRHLRQGQDGVGGRGLSGGTRERGPREGGEQRGLAQDPDHEAPTRRAASLRGSLAPDDPEPGVTQAERRTQLDAGEGRRAPRPRGEAGLAHARGHAAPQDLDPLDRPVQPERPGQPGAGEARRVGPGGVVGRAAVVGVRHAHQVRPRRAAAEDVLDVLRAAAGGREEVGRDHLATVRHDGVASARDRAIAARVLVAHAAVGLAAVVVVDVVLRPGLHGGERVAAGRDGLHLERRQGVVAPIGRHLARHDPPEVVLEADRVDDVELRRRRAPPGSGRGSAGRPGGPTAPTRARHRGSSTPAARRRGRRPGGATPSPAPGARPHRRAGCAWPGPRAAPSGARRPSLPWPARGAGSTRRCRARPLTAAP